MTAALGSPSDGDVIDLKVMMRLGAFNVLVCDQNCNMADIKIQGADVDRTSGPITELIGYTMLSLYRYTFIWLSSRAFTRDFSQGLYMMKVPKIIFGGCLSVLCLCGLLFTFSEMMLASDQHFILLCRFQWISPDARAPNPHLCPPPGFHRH